MVTPSPKRHRLVLDESLPVFVTLAEARANAALMRERFAKAQAALPPPTTEATPPPR